MDAESIHPEQIHASECERRSYEDRSVGGSAYDDECSCTERRSCEPTIHAVVPVEYFDPAGIAIQHVPIDLTKHAPPFSKRHPRWRRRGNSEALGGDLGESIALAVGENPGVSTSRPIGRHSTEWLPENGLNDITKGSNGMPYAVRENQEKSESSDGQPVLVEKRQKIWFEGDENDKEDHAGDHDPALFVEREILHL